MSGSSSSDDEEGFHLFPEDSISEDDNDLDDTSTDNDIQERFSSFGQHSESFDFMDDHDDYRHYPAPMPWPPAVVAKQNELSENSSVKKKKPGIIYLSSIPPGFNVSRTIAFFSQFGKVGRAFLQPDPKEKANRRDKLARNFTEGWIEFLSKRVAKDVAENMNNQQVGGSKRSKAHDVLWNIKYLPKFKWTHLSERLAYERASHTQKMRTEVSQAKRESDFYRSNVERSRRLLKRSKDSMEAQHEESSKVYKFKQKETEAEILKSKRSKDSDSSERKSKKSKNSDKSKKDSESPGQKNRESEKSKKKDKKKDKNKKRKSSDRVSVGGKFREEGEESDHPAKRARTRSSDRKEFLQSIFGSKT